MSRTSAIVDENRAASHIVETRDQVGDRRFAGSARSDQCHYFAGLHFHVDVIEVEAVRGVGIAERYILSGGSHAGAW